MANAMLYYRTPSNTAALVPDPNDLPGFQKLLFTPEDGDHVTGIEEIYDNNIVRRIPIKPKGRNIILRDDGVAGWEYTISGWWAEQTPEADSEDKLKDFKVLDQEDDTHEFGVFGLVYPNGPEYMTLDPIPTKGLMIKSTRGKHVGLSNKVVDFSLTLWRGGAVD